MIRSGRAFSLLEALFTLAIVFLLLGLACDLFTQYISILRFSAAKSTSLTTMQVAMQSIVDEVRGAQTIEIPSNAGAMSSDLKFVKVDPSNPTWLSNSTLSYPAPPAAGWVPVLTAQTQAFFIEVHYYLSDGTSYPVGCLLRDVGAPGMTPSNTLLMAQNVQGMQFTGLPAWSGAGLNAIQVQLTLTESNRTTIITGSSMRPL